MLTSVRRCSKMPQRREPWPTTWHDERICRVEVRHSHSGRRSLAVDLTDETPEELRSVEAGTVPHFVRVWYVRQPQCPQIVQCLVVSGIGIDGNRIENLDQIIRRH